MQLFINIFSPTVGLAAFPHKPVTKIVTSSFRTVNIKYIIIIIKKYNDKLYSYFFYLKNYMRLFIFYILIKYY